VHEPEPGPGNGTTRFAITHEADVINLSLRAGCLLDRVPDVSRSISVIGAVDRGSPDGGFPLAF
jgi:hypothetical protein